MFIGRDRELKDLDRLYTSGKFEFAVIYGRRRVGKTTLINEFIKGKDTIFFTGVEISLRQNLENFSRCIMEYAAGEYLDSLFSSFASALEYVFKLSEEKRIILVIDEYPYVAKSDRSLASTLQLLIDKHKEKSKLFLILCGSSMSYMEDQVLAYKAPLYGRRTAQFKIQPFDFFESCEYFKGMTDEDKAIAYGVIGGTPQYLTLINDKETIEENIKRLYLNPSSSIYEEPVNLLKQEVREPAIYNAIISAIASGYTKMSEISSKVGEETGACSLYIKNLISLGLIKKEAPYGENKGRKAIYSIDDNMFRFWYRFIPDNVSLISRGAVDIVYKRISPHLSSYMGFVFEEICKQYLWRLLLSRDCDFEFSEIGRWWGTNPKTKKQEEIDIMGVGADKALFAECKWTNEKTEVDVLDTLYERSRMFNYKDNHYYLFSKSGFTKGCIKRSEEIGNTTLITYKEIIKDIVSI